MREKLKLKPFEFYFVSDFREHPLLQPHHLFGLCGGLAFAAYTFSFVGASLRGASVVRSAKAQMNFFPFWLLFVHAVYPLFA